MQIKLYCWTLDQASTGDSPPDLQARENAFQADCLLLLEFAISRGDSNRSKQGLVLSKSICFAYTNRRHCWRTWTRRSVFDARCLGSSVDCRMQKSVHRPPDQADSPTYNACTLIAAKLRARPTDERRLPRTKQLLSDADLVFLDIVNSASKYLLSGFLYSTRLSAHPRSGLLGIFSHRIRHFRPEADIFNPP
jgi:hypothetical protein